MNIVLEIIQGLGSIVISLISVYMWVIIISALLSFVNPDPYNPIVQFLNRITQPAFSIVRGFMRTNFNGLDLAPLVIIVALQILIVIISAVLSSIH